MGIDSNSFRCKCYLIYIRLEFINLEIIPLHTNRKDSADFKTERTQRPITVTRRIVHDMSESAQMPKALENYNVACDTYNYIYTIYIAQISLTRIKKPKML